MTSNYRKLWTRRRSDFAAIAAIAAFFVLFFWPLLFGDNYFVTSDAFFYSYPLRTTAWNALHQRSLPLWTPLLLSGYPLISMGQIALGYPLTWGYAFMPGYKAEVIYVLAPFLLAPTFTYFYAREIGRSRLASLLAGLAFGYGGMMAGMLSNSGYTTNSVMWLPLILVGIERTRTYPFAHCVIWTTGAYTMSVLNGHGQTFMYVGLIALAYAVFVAFALMPSAERRRGLRELLTLQRLKPLAVTVTAILVAAGIAAPQILETLRATQFSIRRSLSYEVFVEGSFHLTAMLKSAVLPLHYDLEVTTYLSPLAICLAVFAVASVRHSARDPRVFFWAALALLAWLLMLGGNNPLYRLIYHVPLFNRFRVPARHSFEWTFAAGILAAYGWDAISDWINQRTSNTIGMARRWPRWLGLGALVLALLVGCFWWRAVYSSSEPMFYARTGYPAARYLLWKAGFLLTLFTGAWLSWHVVSHRWRTVLLTTAIVLACFPEPYMLISRWWFTAAKPESRFAVVSPSTRFLQQYPPDQNRVYSRVNLFVEENSLHPSVDPLNLTAIHGLQNVGGYEPLILERYSRALDNVGYDSLTTRPGFAREQTIFNSRSHVLDLLNTRFVLAYSNPLYAEGTFTTKKEGIKFSETDDPVDIKPGETVTLETESIEADTLALVTSLSNSSGEIDGSTVARLRVSTADGRTLEHSLRAGVDTAEWAHERADVRSVVRHRLAKVFNSRPGDQSGSFQAHTYLARIPFGERLRVKHVEIVNVKQAATLVVWKGTFYDSAANYSVPLMNPLVGGDSDRWQLRKPKLPTLEKEGIRFSGEDDAVELGPGETVKVMDVPAEGDTMVLVTSLAHAANEKDQAPVAKLRLRTSYGQVIEHDLRAGVETAEWAHDRPDVRAVVLHHLAPVFDSRQEGSVDGFPAYRYWARIKPGKRVGVREAEIVNTSAQAVLTIWKATLYDAVTRRSTPFSFAKPDRWQPVYEKDNVIILENQRALPRAWLVAEAEVIDSEEALRAIRGEGGKTFDPKRTALVETSPETLPALPGGQISSSASATISLYEPNRLTIKTTADSASMLVVSEVAYPGWHATLDGAEVPIFVTNYLLRGVAVPSGSHVVEMRYTAPRARKGLIISVSILITFAGILVYARRRRGQLSEKAFPHLPLNS